MKLREAEVIADIFDTLEKIDKVISNRRKYTILSNKLHQAIDQKLQNIKIIFPNFSAKVNYLLREYKIRENSQDRSLASAINDARIHMQNYEFIPDAELNNTFAYDFKAVCLFLSLIYDNYPIPETLKQNFSLFTEKAFRKSLKDEKGGNVGSLRCFVDSCDAQFIYATRADNGKNIKIDYTTTNEYTLGDWSYVSRLLNTGCQLNIVKPRTENDIIYPELIIYNPDYLVNVTSIAACFEEYGASTRLYFLNKIRPNNITQHTLLGIFAGQMLDEAAYGKQTSYTKSITDFFQHNALALACCKDIDEKYFHQNAQCQQQHIDNVVRHGKIHQKSNTTLSSEALVLEPSCFCETLGVQGRMDFLHLNLDTIVEQKSGSAAYPINPSSIRQQQKHYVQLLLYRAMFHYAYAKKRGEDLSSYLFYSKYENGLLDLSNAPKLLFEAIKIRNEIAWSELYFTHHRMSVFDHFDASHIFPKAQGNILWERYHKPEIEQTLATIHQANFLTQTYFFRFLRFIANEHMLAKVGNLTKENSGFASLWTSTITEKRQNGNIYEQLTMNLGQNADVVNDLSFGFSIQLDADTSNFRKGDIAIFYPYFPNVEPNATKELLFRCTITKIEREQICVRLRNAQHAQVFKYYIEKGYCWAVEHDFMEASYTALYRGMQALLTATESRRKLILNQRKPSIDRSISLKGDYTNGSSQEFNEVALHAKQAKDIFIIVGPPGTGKTSFGMLNVLKEHLMEIGTNVLLMAYTNRAVDEICSKLVEEGIDFVRMGNDFNCDEAYREYLFEHKIESCKSVEDIRKFIMDTRVMCGTTSVFNSHLEIFNLKQFQLAIIDEASQILEPNILGLLCAKHGQEDAIKKFILIGDEKQLPAVVQQEKEQSEVQESELRAIGLTNCRNSFFERMLNNYGKGNRHYCHVLTHQGRMHPDIAQFPNVAFYQSSLYPVPLEHQREKSIQPCKANTDMEKLLKNNRIAFISCKATSYEEESDKVNQAEANIIAAVVLAAYKMMQNKFDVNKSIGVIVPYRNQILAVRKAIERESRNQNTENLCDITIDTVERYQGSQRDLIVYGFTVRRYYQLAFLTDNEYIDTNDGTLIDRKLNVVMTRARKNLVMVGDKELLNRVPTFHKLIDFMKERKCLF